jgi:hypothetical protein
MGTAGFVVSLVGIVFTCGVICPIGLILSLIGIGKEPKGLAIAGTVIGAVGSLGFVFVGLGIVAGLLFSQVEPPDTLGLAVEAVESYARQMGEIPPAEEGQELIKLIQDAWGNELRYEPGEASFLIRSAGPDGVFDTDDDVVAAGGIPEDR